jgi:hypothetical protein
MNFKGLYDLIMFVGIGGPIMVIGGLIGLYLGLDANQTSGCVLNCPDPWQPAVYGTIPGILIAVGQWLIDKLSKPGR